MAKKQPAARELVPTEAIQSLIYVLRGHRVMLDRDLADLYGVELRRLNEQVKRNRDRFPDDFMFRLTLEEGKAVIALRSQIATLKRGEHLKYAPYVFTEHGAMMLANVLAESYLNLRRRNHPSVPSASYRPARESRRLGTQFPTRKHHA